MLRYFHLAVPLLVGATASPQCKTTPSDATWPSTADWTALNATIDGKLIRTVPAASSCWPGNPFNSAVSCTEVTENWGNGTWHSMQPESIDYPLYANKSCLPGNNTSRGCHIGGLPEYIVNATTEEHVAVSMKWAAARNIRIVVKGTGHDLNGRSSGAFALSIWTRNFRELKRDTAWRPIGATNDTNTNDVFIIGSGQQWGNVLTTAISQGRVVTTGQDPSVGLGGYIQGGGHGPLSSTYGLASHQVLQMNVVTTTGQTLVANDAQNQDLFWALRGGGGGQYGVVTQFVIKHYPVPSNVTMAVLQIKPKDGTNASAETSYDAVARFMRRLPDLIDAGVAGAATIATGNTALKFFPDLQSQAPFKGLAYNNVFWAFNSTEANVKLLLEPAIASLGPKDSINSTLSVSLTVSTFASYKEFYASISGDNAAGGESLVSSRLLGRSELVDTPHEDVVSYLKIAMSSKNETAGNYATIGLQGGPGTRDAPQERWGALLPSWRRAYLHFIATGSSMNSVAAGSSKRALQEAAEWFEEVKEPMWRKWAPGSGAYMNEGNPYDKEFKEDFYGDSYQKLVEVKAKYDPSESLYVLSGVGSDGWEYDLDTGKLCRV